MKISGSQTLLQLAVTVQSQHHACERRPDRRCSSHDAIRNRPNPLRRSFDSLADLFEAEPVPVPAFDQEDEIGGGAHLPVNDLAFRRAKAYDTLSVGGESDADRAVGEVVPVDYRAGFDVDGRGLER